MGIVTMRDFDNPSYSVESEWGTDPVSNRLAFLGDVKDLTFSFDPQREARRSVGSGVMPKGYAKKWKKCGLSLTMDLIDDTVGNSLIGLALGGAPNASGSIAPYPASGYPNLRSISCEFGLDRGGSEVEWWIAKGCIMEALDLTMDEQKVSTEAKWQVKDYTRLVTRTGFLPAEPTTSLFNPATDLSVNFTGVALPINYIQRAKLSIANKLASGPTVGSAGVLGKCTIVGRDVSLELTGLKDVLYMGLLEMQEGNGEITSVELVLSKNSNAEYIKFTLGGCQILGGYEEKETETDADIPHTWTLTAKSIAADVQY